MKWEIGSGDLVRFRLYVLGRNEPLLMLCALSWSEGGRSSGFPVVSGQV